MKRMTLGQLAAVLLESEKTGRPLEVTAFSNRPDSGWIDWDGNTFRLDTHYRVKPEPPKPREWWLNVYGGSRPESHHTREVADLVASPNRTECVHVREVLDE